MPANKSYPHPTYPAKENGWVGGHGLFPKQDLLLSVLEAEALYEGPRQKLKQAYEAIDLTGMSIIAAERHILTTLTGWLIDGYRYGNWIWSSEG